MVHSDTFQVNTGSPGSKVSLHLTWRSLGPWGPPMIAKLYSGALEFT